MAKQYCPNCGEALPANARTCPACGEQIRQPASARREPRTRARRGQRGWGAGRSWLLTLLFGGGLVLLVAALLVMLMQQRTPDRNELPAEVSSEDIPYPDVPRIPVGQAREGHEAGTILFVDVRSAQNYASAHISGALSVPSGSGDAAYTELPRDVQIVTYCT